jgi:ApaG protein
MSGSETTTHGIRVTVKSEFSPERSDLAAGRWFFLYTITITNEGSETVQLLTRHWIISDGEGHVEEVRGDGVVGAQPVLRPGESFRYTSGCPLETAFGTMHGSYRMTTGEGRQFDVEIAPFALSEPFGIN